MCGCSAGSAVTDRRARSVSCTSSESGCSPSWLSQRSIVTLKTVTASCTARIEVNSSTPRSRKPSVITSDSADSFRNSRSLRGLYCPRSAHWRASPRGVDYGRDPARLVAHRERHGLHRSRRCGGRATSRPQRGAGRRLHTWRAVRTSTRHRLGRPVHPIDKRRRPGSRTTHIHAGPGLIHISLCQRR